MYNETFSFQPNNLNVVVSEQSQDQMVEDRLTELEEKKSTYFIQSIKIS